MKNTAQIFTLAVVVICLLTATAFAEVPTTTGAISKVTVYHGQALVTRRINVDLPAGTSELIIEHLPARIVSESIYAQTSGNIRVLSARYREKAIREDTREEVKELDAQIKELNKRIYQTERRKQHLDHQWSMYIKLRDFTVAAVNFDLNRGLLAFKPISELAGLIQKEGQDYIDRTLDFEDQIAELKEDIELLKHRRASLNAGRSRTDRQAVLFISSKSETKSVIELNYLVNGANWLAQYNLRAKPDEADVLIEYNAVVNQSSGENWNGVALSLSTAEPSMVAASPVLEPMPVILRSSRAVVADKKAMTTTQQDLAGMAGGFTDQSQEFSKLMRSRQQEAKGGRQAQKRLEQIAADNQTLEFRISGRDLERFNEEMRRIARIEGISVTYNLPGKLTLPSRTDQQLVTIASVNTQADFTLVATPLLTDYVYLQAELLNDSDTIFLPGPASMFRNGEFVGRSQIPVVTIGEKFTAGFGIDSQVKVSRRLEEKKTKIQGGNCIDTYTYRIALSNYKSSPAELRLLDRLPYTDDDSIKIELLDTDHELSKAPEYIGTDREKGVLRWDIQLAADSADRRETVVTYSFTMEYDRNMQVQPEKE